MISNYTYKLSVVITNYNNFEMLDDCLRTFHQFKPDCLFEIIVVDNASTEGNVSKITSKYESVKLIQNEKNIGFSAANNLATKHASGEYLLFINNDIIFTSNVISPILKFISEKNEEVLVGIRLLFKDGSMQESNFQFTTLWNLFTENFFLYQIFPKSKYFNKYYLNHLQIAQPVETDVVKGCFLFCSADSFIKLNGFDERFFFYAEEADFCYRFKLHIGKVFYLPYLTIIHLGGAGTENQPWFKYRNQITAKIQILQKHFKGFRFLVGYSLLMFGLILRTNLYFFIGVFSLNKNQFIKAYYFLKQIFVYPKNLFKS